MVKKIGRESGNVKFRKVPATKVLSIFHKDEYELLGEAYAYIVKYAKGNNFGGIKPYQLNKVLFADVGCVKCHFASKCVGLRLHYMSFPCDDTGICCFGGMEPCGSQKTFCSRWLRQVPLCLKMRRACAGSNGNLPISSAR